MINLEQNTIKILKLISKKKCFEKKKKKNGFKKTVIPHFHLQPESKTQLSSLLLRSLFNEVANLEEKFRKSHPSSRSPKCFSKF